MNITFYGPHLSDRVIDQITLLVDPFLSSNALIKEQQICNTPATDYLLLPHVHEDHILDIGTQIGW